MKIMSIKFKALVFLVVATSVMSACGGGGGSGSSDSASAASSSSASAASASSAAASSLSSSSSSSRQASSAASSWNSSAAASATQLSAGCGAAAQFSSGKYSLVSGGTTREFWVSVPSGYDKSKAYPLIVGLHWSGGAATDVYNGNSWASGTPFYGLKNLYGDTAIFVAPNGLDSGWANTNDRDINFIQAMVTQLQQGLCVDSSRVYATGFSFGGMMSNAIGCEMGGTFRAIASMSGSLWSGCSTSSKKVAAMLLHSEADAVVAYQYGVAARDEFVSRNQCSSTTVAEGSNGCVEYQGCATGYPVVWCGYKDGGHWPSSFAGKEIKTFFDRF